MNKQFLDDRHLLRLADVTAADLERNRRAIAEGRIHPKQAHVAVWFIPPVSHALKGGVRTVFMFAEQFSRTYDTLNHFVVYSHNGVNLDAAPLGASLAENFPALRFLVRVHRRGKDRMEDIPASNFAFCTLWTTAYLMAKYHQTSAKYYLVQDYEPNFYAAGTVFGAIEHTYRLGYSCIANTPGVGDACRRYTQDVVHFLPGVDTGTFRPNLLKQATGEPKHLVLYGRPSNSRNCFALMAEMMVHLKQRMGKDILIQSVGEAWREADYGLEGVVENLGLLGSMAEVADLYRRADMGLVFMMTPHPSYQPFEYMASGCVVATNVNDANAWLLNDDNALLLEPLADVGSARIEQVLRDVGAWARLREGGLQAIAGLRWEAAFDVVRKRVMESPGPGDSV
ncbi:rhamnosyltransferase WsaF family glycosyltransferase [Luteimonas notoginsengisoli]|uniref:WsaF C-terminal domain-containing protein n=1 Tax=Luteimonas notoginsengisoli TaxID=1578200 RepID=A0ABV7UNU3_9GAMM